MTTTIDLPFPPSVNNLFPSGPSGRRCRSKEYEAWLTEAGWAIKAQRPRTIIGAVQIEITFRDRPRACDLDNRIKPVLDLLVRHGIIDGDHNKTVRKIVAEWGGDIGARVVIWPYLKR